MFDSYETCADSKRKATIMNMKYDDIMKYDDSGIELHLNTFVDSLRVAFVPIQATWLLLPVFTSKCLEFREHWYWILKDSTDVSVECSNLMPHALGQATAVPSIPSKPSVCFAPFASICPFSFEETGKPGLLGAILMLIV